MNKLILTVGLPRSGKTTWALKQGVPVVSRDGIRKALYDKVYISEAEEMVAAIEKYMVKALFLAGHDTVIIDNTHLRKKYRDRWICSRYSQIQWKIELEEFKVDVNICVQRAIKDQRPELIPIIQAMAEESYDE